MTAERPSNSSQPAPAGQPEAHAPPASAAAAASANLVERVICPHCWHRFTPTDVLFVARHADLIGDPVAGDDAYLRFRPSRFSLDGAAIDPSGAESRDLACPRCHLEIPRSLLEVPPIFVSIIGAPASGKSYYLATTTWELRQGLPRLGVTFTDADPAANAVLLEHERRLFLSEQPDQLTFIHKTEQTDSNLHRSVRIGGESTTVPHPFLFTLTSRRGAAASNRALVLYDNAGEHFLPNERASGTQVTEHLARSQVLLFLLDPTQDPRLRAKCASDDPQLRLGPRLAGLASGAYRQEVVLTEAAVRIRRAIGLAQNAKHDAKLIVILAKADIWAPLLGISLADEPIHRAGPATDAALDFGVVKRVSAACRALLDEVCPEVVANAESFCRSVLYVPVSSFGRSPELGTSERSGDFLGIRPKDIAPRWVTVPLLCAIQSCSHRLIPVVGLPASGAETVAPSRAEADA